ncbi:MAG: hypothetical protein KDE01_17055, partial [Caldilineaceae bacterium]|nr:hypothetical protein [Caldilineaceae bacterium]
MIAILDYGVGNLR